MYKIFADDSTLIYDSTLEDYKICKGVITREADKSGSFVFALYRDHFYWDRFVKLKTVVTVTKSDRIVFRGRVLTDVTDYWNKGEFTCEGELGFLQDSVIRPFEFTGTPEQLFKKFIDEHNAQVDVFKRFKVGTCTVTDPNNYINRSTSDYPTTLSVLSSALTGSDLGGHLYITHGDDGADPIPTIHYVAEFPKVAAQGIEFGVNLKDYTKTAKAEDVATAIIPLGTEVDNKGGRLTIKDVNGGVDYLYNEAAVALYGRVFKTVVWDDVTLASNLKAKAEAYLESAVNQAITIGLTAIDLHLLDRSIESYNVCEYVHATSVPHGFDTIMLCNKQTMDLLKPDNDTVTLGYQTTSFTGATTQMAASVSSLGKQVSSIKQQADSIVLSVENGETSSHIELRAGETVISSQDIQFKGYVTFEGLENGTTIIDGGCIKAGSSIEAPVIEGGTMNVSNNFIVDEDGNLTINGNINLSGGSITWGPNAPSSGDSGISEDEARTLITDTLVSSPNIAGGRFYDLGQSAYIAMDASNGAGHRYSQLDFYSGAKCVFSVFSDNTLSDFDPGASGRSTVTMNTLAGTILKAESRFNGESWSSAILPQGSWDFSNATVKLCGATELLNEKGVSTGWFGSGSGETTDGGKTYGVAMASSSTAILADGSYSLDFDSEGRYILVTGDGIKLKSGENTRITLTDNVISVRALNGKQFQYNGSEVVTKDMLRAWGVIS